MPPKNPTHIAQIQAAVEKAWQQVAHTEGDPALMMELTLAAVYVEDLYTQRYAEWQEQGGQSNFCLLDRYKYPPDEQQWPSIATRYEVLGGLQ